MAEFLVEDLGVLYADPSVILSISRLVYREY